MENLEDVKKIFYKGLKIQADLKEKGMSLTYQTMSEDMARLTCQLFPKSPDNPDGYRPFSLKQKELKKWQLANFGDSNSSDMTLGMAEEVGELAHWILKRKQGIREGANGGDFKDEISDAFADVVIYGIQLLSDEGLDAEEAFTKTVAKVLNRNWKENPSGKDESQHKKTEPKPEGRLLTVAEEHELRQEWGKLPEDTRPSWRNYWLQAQRDLTASICKAQEQEGRELKPGEGRLLTDMKVIIDERTKNCVDANYASVKENLEWLVAKTASILETEWEHHVDHIVENTKILERAECKARVKRIFEEIEEHYQTFDRAGNPIILLDYKGADGSRKVTNFWQALREGAMKK
ncbi:hypothetical protein LCGC14_0598950 [marine sediment metagenome]|uniref:NTP pyrophosphohydrolase MazG-like domain-containing protein n=1 Tax=marine sediment metagenome TaxID=412755 RepID=A0A0F9RV29_9ZZZZ